MTSSTRYAASVWSSKNIMISLKNTLFKQLIAVTIAIITVYTLLLYSWFFSGVHFANHEYMVRDAERYRQWYEQDPAIVLPKHDTFAVYLGFGTLPQHITRHFDKNRLSDNTLAIAEVDTDVFGKPQSVILLMPTSVNNHSSRLYIVNTIKVGEKPSPTEGLFNVVILCATLILLVMTGFAARLYALIIKPLNSLGELAQKAVRHNVIIDSRLLKTPNEFGILARTFEQSVDKINRRNAQERQFLQNLSHELRTPIAVIKSAIELVDKRITKGNYDIDKPLSRLQDANHKMQDLSETMLWLARNNETIPSQPFEFAPVLGAVWHDLAYLNDNRVKLITREPLQSTLYAPKELVTILLVNLLRNAIEHCLDSTIFISLSQNTLTISNPSEPMTQQQLDGLLERGNTQQQGFGLGLDIIRQICHKQQWRLKLDFKQPMLTIEVRFCILT